MFRSLLGTMAVLSSTMPAVQAQTAPSNAELLDRILNRAKPGDRFVKTGDMLLSVDNLRAYRGTGSGRQAASAFFRVTLWPGGVVPYIIDPSLQPAQRSFFLQAARNWEGAAKLKFIPRTNQKDYVRVFRDSGDPNYSFIGKIGGEQDLSLGIFSNLAVAEHEIAHALGMMHEQARSNRDGFVTINFDNITTEFQDQFAIIKDSNNRARSLGVYDFGSVMHYGQFDFAIDRSKPTITAKPGFTQFQKTMGQRVGMSAADKLGMAEVYGFLTTDANGVPINDNFANARVIEGAAGKVTGTNKLATKEAGEESSTKANAAASVWYRWRPTSSGTVTFTTKGSAIDTTLGVYLGNSVSTLTPVVYNDDEVMGALTPAAGLTSSVTFTAQFGATYYIAVDSFVDFLNGVGPTGAITLNWNQKAEISAFKLSGSVRTPTTPAQGVAGVTIALSGADQANSAASATATTDSSGNYTISNLPAGNYNLRPSKTGFVCSPSPLRVTLSANSTGNDFTAMAIPTANLPEMSVSDVSKREGNTGENFVTFNVSISAPSQASVTVNYETVNGAAIAGSDYNVAKGKLTFAPGTTSMTVNVRILPDTTVEPNETFSLKLSGAAGARIVKESGVAIITNDDSAAAADSSARSS